MKPDTIKTRIIPGYGWIAATLVVILTVAIYWQCGHHPFINYDDPGYVTENVHVREGLTLPNIYWAFTTFAMSNWHPLTWLSHMFDVQLFGVNPGAHHLVSVLFHIANALLLLYLLWHTTGCWWRSLTVAALFALHPIHVESVAWVAERKDVLSTFFMLVTMILYGRYAMGRRVLPYMLALAAFGLGLLAKPMLVTLPLVLFLWDLWPLGRLRLRGQSDANGSSHVAIRRLLIEKVPFLGLTVVSCLITYYAQQRAGAVAGMGTMPLSFRVINALTSYVGYLKKTVWPIDLAIIYPLPATLSLVQGIAAGALLLLATILVCRSIGRFPFLATGWLWYLVTLAPVIGLVQVGQQAMADRYTYIPLIGIFMMIAWGVPSLLEKRPALRIALPYAAVLAAAALALSAWLQVGYWKDSVTLFRHACAAVTNNQIAWRILGSSLAQEGRYDEAVRAFAEALRIRPDDQETHNAWGVSLARQKRAAEAEGHYLAALRIDPEYATAHYNLGSLLAGEGRFGEAIDQYLTALRFQPGQPDIYLSLGEAYAGAGDLSNALDCYKKALAHDPGNADIIYSIGLTHAMRGDIKECIAWLNRALKARPAFAEAHYNLGVAFARSGRLDEGISHFKEALRINPGLDEARRALETALKRKAGHP